MPTRPPAQRQTLALIALSIFVVTGAACEPAAPMAEASAKGPAGAPDDRLLALAGPGSHDDAVDDVLSERQDAVLRSDRKSTAWVRLANAWMEKAEAGDDPGFRMHADAAARIALVVDPTDADAAALRARIALDDGRCAAARDLAQDLVLRAPGHADAWGTLSDALVQTGNVDGADVAAKRADAERRDAGTLSRLAALRWLHGDVAGARALHAGARAALRPDDETPARAHASRSVAVRVEASAAHFEWEAGDIDAADAGFAHALAAVPDDVDALVGRARCAFAREKDADAVHLLGKALARHASIDALALLSTVQQRLGNAEASKSALARAFELGARTDRRATALLLANVNLDIPRALALLEDERRTRGDVDTDDAYAWALYRLGRLPEARAHSDRARRLGTKSAELLFHAGAIRIAQGEDEGRALVDAALQSATLAPDNRALAESLLAPRPTANDVDAVDAARIAP